MASSSKSKATVDLDERIQQIVDTTIQRNLEVTLETASSVAEKIATSFLEKQQQKLEREKSDEKNLGKVTLKGKGNQRQLDFCKDILEKIEKANSSMDENNVEKTKEHLSEGKKLVMKRVKLIKLADREDWATVNEYMSDDLASDSEDEKQINRAIRSASAKSDKRRKSKQRQSPYYIGNQQTDNRRLANSYSNRLSLRPYNHLARRETNFENKVCWGCGRVGHFMSDCRSSNQSSLSVPKTSQTYRNT